MSTAPLPFLEQKTITFNDGTSLELGDAITDFRQCHDEFEKRILYHCRRRLPPSSSPPERISSKVDDEDLIVKIKVQIPDPDNPTAKTTSSTTTPASQPLPPGHPDSDTCPSWSTMREFQALRNIMQCHCCHAPHLVFLDTLLQGPDDPLPGGYINFLVMSRLPGKSLFDLGYWSLEAGERKAIQEGFLKALWAVREVDIEPDDRGLRNVMWDRESGSCALVDFEMWQNWSGCKNQVGDVKSEEGKMEDLRRWGLASKPPAKNWWAEFGIETR